MGKHGIARTAGVRMFVGMGAVALLTLGTASAASAEEVVIEHLSADPESPFDFGFTLCNDEALGQSFTATATGSVTEVTIFRSGIEATTTLSVYDGDGTSGEPVSTQLVSFADDFGFEPRVFTLEAPLPVVAGNRYSFEFEHIPECQNQAFVWGAYGYNGGTSFLDDVAQADLDLAFRVVIDTSDEDGDKVADAADQCAGTTFGDAPDLRPNRLWSTSVAGFADRDGVIRYTLADTAGCSAEQIIAAAGLGKGHGAHGISVGALRDWVAATH
ncbi:hypothetical protein LQ757_12440 [Agromyces sp. SYSU K20354]|uniref:hypothetical protein n=1 Tax=Agromyces cavernae TaxID=2898659 RepID=UPI001E57716C|nr:hypothetical protein [Agromyces cavernae]MCD2443083.1 hypothetical protein [Agromyces cavernae]